MNILMLSLLYPQDQIDEVTRNAKDKLQNQINNYQWAFVDGIRSNLNGDEKLDILNSLPVGIFPLQYRQLFLRKGTHDGTICQLGGINLPWFKQTGRRIGAIREIERWVKMNPQNRTLLLYTQYLPYMEAVAHLKKRYHDLKAAVIVTDLPNDFGLASGRKGLMKKLEYLRGNKSMELCQKMDGFILLTDPMAEALKISHKPYTVIEGLIQAKPEASEENITCDNFTALYTGTLEPDLGIRELLQAFSQRPQYELWICGHGSLQQEVQDIAAKHSNIKFYGFVPQKEALALQAKASVLINPRSPEGVFTRYSFPSKTLEYLRSGKPVICYKLEGIPDDYDPYLCYITDTGSDGILKAVDNLACKTEEERASIGQAGREYVLYEKNQHVQCRKLIDLLRKL
ncbi:MAG: glycosyltransferase [Clostridia bacterium]|nr:glycosyltransferase [Clostridia bacterium]